MLKYFFFVFSTILMGTNTFAQITAFSTHPLEQIRDTAQAFIHHQIPSQTGIKTMVSIGYIDPRLRLQLCDQNLIPSETNPNTRASQRIVKIACPGSKPWSIFVPVKVSQRAKVLVAKKIIHRGTRISAEDLLFSEQNLARLTRGYFLSTHDINTMLAKRTITAKTIITPSHLKLPFLIKKGQNVTIFAEVSGIEIKMQGKAMMNGAKGDLIKVKNSSSEKVLQVIVKAAGKVEVPL